MAVGAVLGIAMGEIMRRSFNALDLELEGIYPVLSLALALLTYGLTTFLHGSGFLAVYLAGLIMQRKPFTHQQSVLRFHDGLAWLMQVTMFLMLSAPFFTPVIRHPNRLNSSMDLGSAKKNRMASSCWTGFISESISNGL